MSVKMFVVLGLTILLATSFCLVSAKAENGPSQTANSAPREMTLVRSGYVFLNIGSNGLRRGDMLFYTGVMCQILPGATITPTKDGGFVYDAKKTESRDSCPSNKGFVIISAIDVITLTTKK